MPVYTVHEPPLKAGEAVNPDRFVFVRDRFSFWAFLLTPLWLLVKRLWIALILYLVFSAAVAVLLHVAGAGSRVRFAVMVLTSILIGLEAATIQRWTLARRKWKQTGVVVADNSEEAEQRFFMGWAVRQAPPAAGPSFDSGASQFVAPAIRTTPEHPIGLFPQPGAPR